MLEAGGVLSTDSLDIGLRNFDNQGHPGELIRGDEELFTRQPVSMRVAIPGGAWQIAAVRKGGWPKTAATGSPLFYIGFINSLFVAAFIWWLVARPYRERARNRALRQEIADKIRAEEELRLSEQKYASIFHLMPDMVGITRMADGCFWEINAGFTRISGWEKEEIIGRSSLEIGLWTPEARAGAVAIVKEKGWLEN
jgi:PAS domain-containing protein